ILSDATIWLAYFIIPVILVLFIQKRKDVPFLPIFWLFGAFIILCGTTHILDVVTFWEPIYRLSAVVRALTAIISMITVFQIVKTLPQAHTGNPAGAIDDEKVRRAEAERDLEDAKSEIAGLKSQLAKLSAAPGE